MASFSRLLATIVVATLLAVSSFSTALARHAESRGEDPDVESTSKLEREFAPGRLVSSSRSGRGKHRSASCEVIPFGFDPSVLGRRSAIVRGIFHQAAASEWEKKNGCGAFLLI